MLISMLILILLLEFGARNRYTFTWVSENRFVSPLVSPPGDSDASRDSAVALSVGGWGADFGSRGVHFDGFQKRAETWGNLG